jgi:outer membrane protein
MRNSAWLLVLCIAMPAAAQWTLPEVVRRAGQRNPGVTAAFEQAAAAASGVRLARTAWLPQGDVLGQLNGATRNNVFGMLLPQRVIAPISGPPVAESSASMVFGTAAGVLVSWEPFDLGQRAAHLAAADAERRRAERSFARRRFEVEAAAADTYFSVVAADQLVAAARAGLERAKALELVATKLAETGLKPGADAARARAERAAAEAAVIHAEQAARVARAALTGITGDEPADVKPQTQRLLGPAGALAASGAAHPRHAEQQAAAAAADARRHELALAWRPRFELQGSLYGRGTGANFDQTTSRAPQGLYPNFYNWGLGFTVTFPFLDRPAHRARHEAEGHRAAAETARLRQIELELKAQVETARATVEAAERLTATTPVQLEAARAAHEQAQVRYRSGLTGIIEVADAQRQLAQAEIEDSLARLGVWRALLALATAQGDLNPFLEAVER